MHSELEEAANALGLAGQLRNLNDAHYVSQAFIESAKSSLLETAQTIGPDGAPLVGPAEPLDVVAFGSYARFEAREQSDFDYLIIAYGLPSRQATTRTLLRVADKLRELPKIQAAERERILFQATTIDAGEVRPPGRTGLFGRIVAAADLTERIGLEQDTNQSHTIRMLLLEESVSLFRPDLHETLIRAVLQRYLGDYTAPKSGTPRFLLNDVIRYWRTLAVDYQAKRYEQMTPEWGLRYLKLIISRKLSFAGTLASLFLCDEDRPASVDHLYTQICMPALARLAQLHRYVDEDECLDSLKSLLLYADAFNGLLADPDWREAVKAVSETHGDDGAFRECREMAEKLQAHLEVLFYNSELLGPRARRYLSF